MKLKIISDGTGRGTKVVDAETGEELKYVTEIVWRIEALGYASATVYLDFVAFEGLAVRE